MKKISEKNREICDNFGEHIFHREKRVIPKILSYYAYAFTDDINFIKKSFFTLRSRAFFPAQLSFSSGAIRATRERDARLKYLLSWLNRGCRRLR